MARKRYQYADPLTLTLGVDPGIRSGAAVWRVGDSIAAAMVWLQMPRKAGTVWRVKTACDSRLDTATVQAFPLVFATLPSYLPPVGSAVIEGQYIQPSVRGKRKVNQGDTFVLAHTAGAAWLGLAPSSDVIWPLASQWRPFIGAGGLSADAAEQAAWTHAYSRFAWPGELGPWLDSLTMVEAGAVAESAVMAGVYLPG